MRRSNRQRLPFASRKWWTVSMDEMLDLLHQKAYEETKKRNRMSLWWSIAKNSWEYSCFIVPFLFDQNGYSQRYYVWYRWSVGYGMRNGCVCVVYQCKDSCDYAKGRYHAFKCKVSLLTSTWNTACKKIDELSTVQEEVIANMAPHLLGRYLISVCQLFNTYYNEVHISNSADDVDCRIVLLKN